MMYSIQPVGTDSSITVTCNLYSWLLASSTVLVQSEPEPVCEGGETNSWLRCGGRGDTATSLVATKGKLDYEGFYSIRYLQETLSRLVLLHVLRTVVLANCYVACCVVWKYCCQSGPVLVLVGCWRMEEVTQSHSYRRTTVWGVTPVCRVSHYCQDLSPLTPPAVSTISTSNNNTDTS